MEATTSNMHVRPSSSNIRRRRLGLALSRTPLRRIIGWYYWSCLGLLVLFLRRRGDVCGIVLAGSAARGTLRYGVSDIDFLVVIESGPQAERVRDDVLVDLDLLRRFLVPLANADEANVLTCSELDTLRITRPHLFVKAGRLKPVFARDDFDTDAFVTPGRQLDPPEAVVRVAELSDVWRKFLIHLEHASYDEALARNVLDRVVEMLGDDLPSDRRQVPEPAIVLGRLLDAIASATGVDGLEANSMRIHRSVIPNRLFRETLPVALLRDFSEIPEQLAIVHRESGGVAERGLGLEELRAHVAESGAHYLYFGGVLLPLVTHPLYGILTPDANPSTFAAMSGGASGSEPIHSLADINAADAAALVRDTDFIFPNGASGLLFAVREILHWSGRDDSSGSAAIGSIEAIESMIDVGAVSEACFAAQALLRGETRSKLRVSVLVPTFNRSALLEQTLRTLLVQSRTPDEILIVDNGSTDSTPDLLDRISSEHPHVRWVVEEQRGFVAVRNRLVREADPRSDIVLFVDDDCLTPPGWVRDLMLPFEYDPDVVSCGGGVTFRDDDCTPWGDFYRQKYKGHGESAS